jgi:hypothetical protein
VELNLRVVANGETYELKALPWVIMLWERRYKTKVSRVSAEGLGLEDMAYMAYECLKLKKHEGLPPTFDLFAQTVTSLELAGDSATPTNAAPSAD